MLSFLPVKNNLMTVKLNFLLALMSASYHQTLDYCFLSFHGYH